jgi:enoyl-CoA hydratase/carnithine racemase
LPILDIGDSKLGFVHAKNGICCGWSGGFRLVQLVGPARALELLASGRLVKADEAQQLGLCERRVGSLDDAIKFAKEHAIESGRTSAAIKTLVGLGHASAERALQVERQLFASTWGKPAHLRALERNVKHGAK